MDMTDESSREFLIRMLLLSKNAGFDDIRMALLDGDDCEQALLAFHVALGKIEEIVRSFDEEG